MICRVVRNVAQGTLKKRAMRTFLISSCQKLQFIAHTPQYQTNTYQTASIASQVIRFGPITPDRGKIYLFLTSEEKENPFMRSRRDSNMTKSHTTSMLSLFKNITYTLERTDMKIQSCWYSPNGPKPKKINSFEVRSLPIYEISLEVEHYKSIQSEQQL